MKAGNVFSECIVNIIQIYALTATSSDEDIEKFYEDLEQARRNVDSFGDFNAKVGEGREENIVGPHGLGIKTGRKTNLKVSYRHPYYRKYIVSAINKKKKDTEKLRRQMQKQVNFILISKRFRNTLLNKDLSRSRLLLVIIFSGC